MGSARRCSHPRTGSALAGGSGDGSSCYNIPWFLTRYLTAGKQRSLAATAALQQSPALAARPSPVLASSGRCHRALQLRFGNAPTEGMADLHVSPSPVWSATGHGHCWREARRKVWELQQDGKRPERGREKILAAGLCAAFYLCCDQTPGLALFHSHKQTLSLALAARTVYQHLGTATDHGTKVKPLRVPGTVELTREHPLFQPPLAPLVFWSTPHRVGGSRGVLRGQGRLSSTATWGGTGRCTGWLWPHPSRYFWS